MQAALWWSICLAGLLLLDLVRRRQLTPLSPAAIYLAFHVVAFLFRGAHVILGNDWRLWSYMVGTVEERLVVRVLWYASGGLLLYWLGYFAPFGRLLAARTRLPDIQLDRRKTLLLGLGFVALGVWSFWRYQGAALFGRGNLQLMEQTEQGMVFVGSSGYAVLANYLIGGVILLWAGVFGVRWWLGLVIAPYYAARLWHGYSRITVFLNAFGVAILDRVRSRRRLVYYAYLISLPLQVLIFSAVGANRQFMQDYLQGVPPEAGTALGRSDVNWNDIANFDSLAWVLDTRPKYLPYSFGLHYVDRWFIQAIPRALWHGKRWLYQPADPAGVSRYFSGSTTSAVGDFYVAFGPPGVVVGMFLLGLVSRIWYSLFRLHESKVWFATLYCVVLSYYPQLGRDGIAAAPGMLFFIVAPTLLALLLCRQRRLPVRRSGTAAEEPAAAAAPASSDS
jgi:hypothetical protein